MPIDPGNMRFHTLRRFFRNTFKGLVQIAADRDLGWRGDMYHRLHVTGALIGGLKSFIDTDTEAQRVLIGDMAYILTDVSDLDQHQLAQRIIDMMYDDQDFSEQSDYKYVVEIVEWLIWHACRRFEATAPAVTA